MISCDDDDRDRDDDDDEVLMHYLLGVRAYEYELTASSCHSFICKSFLSN